MTAHEKLIDTIVDRVWNWSSRKDAVFALRTAFNQIDQAARAEIYSKLTRATRQGEGSELTRLVVGLSDAHRDKCARLLKLERAKRRRVDQAARLDERTRIADAISTLGSESGYTHVDDLVTRLRNGWPHEPISEPSPHAERETRTATIEDCIIALCGTRCQCNTARRLRALLVAPGGLSVYVEQLEAKEQQLRARLASQEVAMANLRDEILRERNSPPDCESSPAAHGIARRYCICPGCLVSIPACWPGYTCLSCAAEDCEHDEPPSSPPSEPAPNTSGCAGKSSEISNGSREGRPDGVR